MTALNNPHHLAGLSLPNPDPLTDSGIRRAIGTQVRLHLAEGEPVTVGLLDIENVSTWSDVAMLVGRRVPITVRGPVRMAFAGGAVVWAEAVSDRVEA